jgi:FixJ family two-component response regulator
VETVQIRPQQFIADTQHCMPDLKQNIVVVDDDAEMNQAVKRLLNAAGFCAMTFDSAEALLEAYPDTSVGCMVLDIHLQGSSGFELRRRLQQKGFNAPVIFITAYDDPSSQAQAKDAGAVAYFTKPFSGKSLLAAVKKAIHLNSENQLKPTN